MEINKVVYELRQQDRKWDRIYKNSFNYIVTLLTLAYLDHSLVTKFCEYSLSVYHADWCYGEIRGAI